MVEEDFRSSLFLKNDKKDTYFSLGSSTAAKDNKENMCNDVLYAYISTII